MLCQKHSVMQNTATSIRAELILWHLTDSALPTGSFAHSAGLETFIQANDVHDPDSYQHWLHSYLRQASFTEALTVRFAVELVQSDKDFATKLRHLNELDQLVHACQTAKQVRTSMNSMGKRMAKIALTIAPDQPIVEKYYQAILAEEMHGNPAIAVGLLLGSEGVSPRQAVTAYLMQMANSMTQNAIRAIPLGQDAGQRVLVSAYEVIIQAAQLTMTHTVADLGAVAPRLEVAQMQHETLRSRMFMS
ncbi:urease accessory protein [Corynebacterium kutscheri]|uniref:Urease accessory protein UreF n=2 Tax=Corynebacterium kutscheri TaxID=35755 RepID=A0AB38VQ14_9CORY|nr:urease accessory protein [Corynebacterium kutscheri]VEH80765.1 urease accessory protein [Corynebacterium kutscheri]